MTRHSHPSAGAFSSENRGSCSIVVYEVKRLRNENRRVVVSLKIPRKKDTVLCHTQSSYSTMDSPIYSCIWCALECATGIPTTHEDYGYRTSEQPREASLRCYHLPRTRSRAELLCRTYWAVSKKRRSGGTIMAHGRFTKRLGLPHDRSAARACISQSVSKIRGRAAQGVALAASVEGKSPLSCPLSPLQLYQLPPQPKMQTGETVPDNPPTTYEAGYVLFPRRKN
jgi:hypothetical protein